MIEPDYRGRFNNAPKKAIPARKHRIVEYKAKDDYVLCTCDFEGTVEAFEAHCPMTDGNKSNYHRLMEDIQNARRDYYLQGSTGYYNAAEDGSYGG